VPGTRADIWRTLTAETSTWIVAPVALLVIQQLLWPAPIGALVQGLVLGLLTSLVGVGIILVHRANNVLNFAQGELGLLPTTVAVMLWLQSGITYFLAFTIGLVGAIVVGMAAELVVIRRFTNSPRLILTIATLGLAQLLGLAALLVPRWWNDRVSSQRIDSPFNLTVDIGSFRFNDNHLMVLVVVPVVLAAVGWLLHRTRLGLAIRASAESPDLAATLGISVKMVQSAVWALASALAFVALWLRAGVLGLPIGGALGLAFFLRALAASVVARLTDIRAMLTTSLALGALQAGIVWNADSPLRAEALTATVSAGVILVALLIRPRMFTRADGSQVALAMGETRPIPPELANRWEVRAVRVALVAVVIAVSIAIPMWFGAVTILRVSALHVFTILGLSLVVLTGWAGQISLGQLALSSAGAAAAATSILQWQADLTLAVVAGGVVGALLATLVGLPALRLSGLYLAVTTLAFAVAMTSYFLNPRFFAWLPDGRIERLPLFGRLGWTSPTGMYVVSAIGLVIALVGVHGIRHSRTGRVLLALRDNENGVTAFGVSVVRAKLTAFAISGFLAGSGGALFVVHQQSFGVGAAGGSIGVLIAAVVGGIGSPLGAFLGALFLWGTEWWLRGSWRLLASGIGVLAVLLIAPGGLASLVAQGRDAALRSLARRRSIVVPSLVADGLGPATIAAATEPETPTVQARAGVGDEDDRALVAVEVEP